MMILTLLGDSQTKGEEEITENEVRKEKKKNRKYEKIYFLSFADTWVENLPNQTPYLRIDNFSFFFWFI